MNLAYVTTCRYCAIKYQVTPPRKNWSARIWFFLSVLFFVFILLVLLYCFCDAFTMVYA